MTLKSSPNKQALWLLPDGVEELLPEEAEALERIRRQTLDLFRSWGYELVFPPLIEFLDALLVGSGSDLDLQTFKVSDPLSGRLLGIRADMTPQVARIDAHFLRRETPTRLCYVGPVLHAYSDPLERSRNPIQVGAEFYGYKGVAADIEILDLLVTLCEQLQITSIYLHVGHVALFRALVREAGLKGEEENTLFSILQRRSRPDLEAFLKTRLLPSSRWFDLLELRGGPEVLCEARQRFQGAPYEFNTALEDLEAVASAFVSRESVRLHFDLAHLRGYRYHTGIVFSAISKGGREIARGGRYDEIGRAFGRARPAVGFSADLKQLLRQTPLRWKRRRVYAPPNTDPELKETIAQLRREGWQVVQALPGMRAEPQELGCTHQLVRERQGWQVVQLEE